MEKSQEDAGQLKNLRFRLISRNSFRLSIVRLPKLDVSCSGDRGRGSNLVRAATAAISINARDVVSQTFCIIIYKDKNRQAPVQPWTEGIISTEDGFLLSCEMVFQALRWRDIFNDDHSDTRGLVTA
jgi:hypothetical protein